MGAKPLLRFAVLTGLLLLLSAAAVGSPLLFFAKAAPASRERKHEYRHEIDKMEDAWRTAVLQGNSVALDALLSDDYTAITAKGAIETKEQAVSSLRSGTFHLTAISASDRKIRVYGSTAVVTSLVELAGKRDKEDLTGRYRYTRVYVRNAVGLWKIVSFEASKIQESPDHK